MVLEVGFSEIPQGQPLISCFNTFSCPSALPNLLVMESLFATSVCQDPKVVKKTTLGIDIYGQFLQVNSFLVISIGNRTIGISPQQISNGFKLVTQTLHVDQWNTAWLENDVCVSWASYIAILLTLDNELSQNLANVTTTLH